MEGLGLQVNRLIRLSFGPFQLGDLEPGLVEEVRTKVLREQLGQKLAEEAGVDFESPVREPIAPFGSTKREMREQPQRARRFERERGDDDHPRHRREHERPFRAREERPARGRRDEATRERPSRESEPRHSVWRADGDEKRRKGAKAHRHGVDPKEARAASGERKHERVGAIRAGKGRKVVVERLVSEPKPERPARLPRDETPRRERPESRPKGPRGRR